MPFQFLDSLLVRPQATHQPLGPWYLQTSMQGLFLRLLIRFRPVLLRNPPQCLFYPRFQFSKPGELFEDPLIEVLKVQGHRPDANTVARAHRLVALPASDSVTFDGQEFLDEPLL